MSNASRFRMTIAFLRVFGATAGAGLVLVMLGIGTLGALPLAFGLGLALIALAIAQLPVTLAIGGAVDATRAIDRAVRERRIRTEEREQCAGLLSVTERAGGELSETIRR